MTTPQDVGPELRRRLHERIAPQANREADELKAALGAADDLLLPLLKFHLWAEQLLERLISANLKRPDRILHEGRLSFAQKLMLVHAFDVVDDAGVGALRVVNSLRNDFAHTKDRILGVSDVDRIGQPLANDYRAIKREHGGDLKALLIFTLARVAMPFIRAVLVPEVEAHHRAELARAGAKRPPEDDERGEGGAR